jgi:hypothetical protein
LVQAHKWLNLASGAGEPNAMEGKREIEASMTQKQIEKAQSLASEWMAQSGVLAKVSSAEKNVTD